MAVSIFPDLHDGLAEDGRVAYMVLCDEGVVGRCVMMAAAFPAHYRTEEYHAEYHTDEAERIGCRAGHRHVVCAFDVGWIGLKEGLLCGSEHRGVGDCSGEKSHHVAERNV